jgi:hypothetical protein
LLVINASLVESYVQETIAGYLENHLQTRIAYLHLDLGLPVQSEFVLNSLFDKVVPNGLIVFDVYNTVEGETNAVDILIETHKSEISKSTSYLIPAYVQKPD